MSRKNLPEVYLDADVAFDIISKREPHFDDAIPFLELVAEDKISLSIGECSLANLIYLAYDIYKLPDATSILMDFIASCEVLSGGKPQMVKALKSTFKDKEDALQYHTALLHDVDYFITRNTKDYKSATKKLPVLTPRTFLKVFIRN